MIGTLDGHADLYPHLMLIVQLLMHMELSFISLFKKAKAFKSSMYKCLLFNYFQFISVTRCTVSLIVLCMNTLSLFVFETYVVTLHYHGEMSGMVILNVGPNE